MAGDRTGSQAGLLPPFPIDKTQGLVLVSLKWILKDKPVALSLCVGHSEEGGTAALGAFPLPALLPLCYFLALDILIIPYTSATPM